MKARTLASILILVLAILIIVGNCATGKKVYVAKEDEEIYGTWVNTDYNYTGRWAKGVFHPDGTFVTYQADSSITPYYFGTFTITEKWTDSEGNIWYKIISIDQIYTIYYELHKISNNEMTWEYVWSNSDYPKEIDPDDTTSNRKIYYRQ
jgi:hypothetical protein